MRAIALTQTDEQGASARLRIYACAPYLRERGIDFEVVPTRVRASTTGYLAAALRLLRQRKSLARRADVFIIQRDLINHLKPWLEQAYARTGLPLVFDIDDAIDLRPPGFPPTWRSRLLGCEDKIEALARLAHSVVVGNDTLATTARRGCPRVTVIPTALDLSAFPPPPPRSLPEGRPVVIGWIGSPLTTPYLEPLRRPLASLAAERSIVFRTIGAAPLNWPELPVEQRPWSAATQDEEVAAFDIGVMPLFDDAWSRGKCGTKIIQYFVAGVPAIASPVGMNTRALRGGAAGLLASSEDQWLEALRCLTGEPERYAALSLAGRRCAEEDFDIRGHIDAWERILREAATAR